MGKWEKLKGLSRKHIAGNLAVSEVINHPVFRNNLNNWGVPDTERVVLAEIFETVVKNPAIKDISSLRGVLIKNPKELELDAEKIQALLILFVDRRTGAEFLRKNL